MRKPSELASIRSRDLVLVLCIVAFAMLSMVSFTWHLRAERTGIANWMEETWPAGPAVWIALSVMLVLRRWSLPREGQWQMAGWQTATVLVWVLATALMGWLSMYLAGNVTGFPSNAHHAMLWTTMTLGIAQLGLVTIMWKHMTQTLLQRVTRLTSAFWGGIVLGISLPFSVFAIIEGLAFRGGAI